MAIYCAAVAVIEISGQKTFNIKATQKLGKNKYIPALKKRLENNINYLRSQVDIIGRYLENNHSENVLNKIKDISRKSRIRLTDSDSNQKLLNLKDTLRQKAKLKGARLRRYNEIAKRKEQNAEFRNKRKQFFRKLDNSETINTNSIDVKQRDIFLRYWSAIWSETKNYNRQANWIDEMQESNNLIPEMADEEFTVDEVTSSIKKKHNWTGPGPDKLHNYWLKKLTSAHAPLTVCFNKLLSEPSTMPKELTEGRTTLLPKKGDLNKPENYRPITCLSVVYKLLTSLLKTKIYKFCIENKLIADEQQGCIEGSLGCKVQLTIDGIIIHQTNKKKRNLHMCYIDYKKAFDSVPHDWLVKILDIYRINPRIKYLLQICMSNWKTNLHVNNDNLGSVLINRGIFQGDSLSPLWFCLAINPLSKLLNNNSNGFRINTKRNTRISHLLYMDDLKLFAETEQKLHESITTVKNFSDNICMSFGLDKCGMLNIKKGKATSSYEAFEGIEDLNPNTAYKYLGIYQSTKINHKKLKEEFISKYKSRVTRILNTKLSGLNIITAINTWAVPILLYTFGVLKWSDTDLHDVDRLTRKILTKFRCLHPKSSTIRLYLPRNEGGRGLQNIYKLCKTQILKIRSKLHASNNDLLSFISEYDSQCTPLNLENTDTDIGLDDVNHDVRQWKEKVLHGRFPALLHEEKIDNVALLTWLKNGQLYPETKGFVTAIYDRVIRTRN